MWRFRHLLSLQIALAAALPLLVLLVIVVLVIAPQLRTQVETRHQAVATALAGQVEGYLFGAGRELSNVARLLNTLPKSDWQSILDTHAGKAGIFNNILVVNENGFTTLAGLPLWFRSSRNNFIGMDLSQLPFYRQMKQTGMPSWSNSYLSGSSGELTIAYALPLDHFDIVGEIDLKRLSDFIKRIATEGELEIMIIDSAGALVAHPRPELTGQQLSLRHLPIVASGLEGHSSTQVFEYQGTQLVGTSVPVQRLGWIALVTQSTSIAFRSVTLSSLVVVIALGISLVISAVGGLALANWVSDRIRFFSENARRISTGTYDLKWPNSRVLEFNALSTHLGDMASAIQAREIELHEQRLRFQTAFETSPLAMSIVEIESGIFLEVNSAWRSVMGYAPDQVVGKIVEDLGIWIDTDAAREFRNLVAVSGTVHDFETRLRRSSGEIAEVELTSSSITVNGIDYILTVIIDVTERNRLNQQLRSTEMLQAAILDSAGHSIISTTPDGTITTFNRTAEAMLGYSADEMIGKLTPAAFHDPEEITARAEEFTSKLGQPVNPGFEVFVAHSKLGLSNEFEWTYVRKDGSRFPVLLTITALRDVSGDVTGYLGLAIDITQRKLAEANLLENEQRLTRQKLAIMHLAREQREQDNLPDLLRAMTELLTFAVDVERASVWTYDGESKSITCLDLYDATDNRHTYGMELNRDDNPVYFQALETERVIIANDALQTPETRAFADSYLKPLGIGAMLDATILRGSQVAGVVCFEHTGGTREWTIDEQNFASAMADFMSLSMELHHHQRTSEELQKYKEGLEDIVEMRTRQLKSLNTELESFSYSVSHDLRAPLRSIDGFSQALLEDFGDKLDSTGRNYLERVRGSTQRMGNLIDDLLKLSRINRKEIRRTEVDLSGISKEIVEQLTSTETDREIDISVAPGLIADGDAGLLRIVMENLIGNAWKYTGKTETPKIEVGSEVNNGSQVYFVRDNGAGFDMAFTSKLFGAFQRFHRPEDFQGSGIGLATVSRIINRHGGRIWAEAKPNKGAVFYFTTE